MNCICIDLHVWLLFRLNIKCLMLAIKWKAKDPICYKHTFMSRSVIRMSLAFNNQLHHVDVDTLNLWLVARPVSQTKDFNLRSDERKHQWFVTLELMFPSIAQMFRGLKGREGCLSEGWRHKKICKVTPKQVSRIIFKSRNAEQKQKILFWTDNMDKKQALKMSQFLIPKPFGGQLFCQWRSFRKSRSYLSQLN